MMQIVVALLFAAVPVAEQAPAESSAPQAVQCLAPTDEHGACEIRFEACAGSYQRPFSG